jgi:hypothetical protein
MAMYHVQCSADPVTVRFGGEMRRLGFFKNEYVWAPTENAAAARARNRVLHQLRELGVPPVEVSVLEPKIEFTRRSYAIWRLWAREGFAFFPSEASTGQ